MPITAAIRGNRFITNSKTNGFKGNRIALYRFSQIINKLVESNPLRKFPDN